MASWPVIGHGVVVKTLQQQVRRGLIGHAYLLYGPANIGKTTLAEHFAAALLCPAGTGGVACDDCASCRQQAAGVHPDFHRVVPTVSAETIQGRPTITLAQILELQAALARRPVLARRHVAVIVAGDQLRETAANALLKTLEEPSGASVLVMTCDAVASLPLTVRSRCRQLRLALVPTVETTEALRRAGVPLATARQLAVLAAGRPGRALVFAEHPEQRDEYAAALAGFGQLVAGSLSQRLSAVNLLQRRFVDAAGERLADALRHQLELWQAAGRDRLLAAAGCPHLCQWAVSRNDIGTPSQWRLFLDTLRDVRAALQHNANPRLALEVLVLALPRVDVGTAPVYS